MSLIEIKHLRKEYSDVTPLRDVNARIDKGEVISIIGPSGTGKSTLLRCINRLETPTSGQIIVDGVDMCDPSTNLAAMRRKMGMVFQNYNLFDHLLVAENIMMAPMDLLRMPKQEAWERALKLLDMVGLKDKALSRPRELSGGQRQRVAIARRNGDNAFTCHCFLSGSEKPPCRRRTSLSEGVLGAAGVVSSAPSLLYARPC